MPEPVMIDSVVVQVDGGSAIDATLTPVKNLKQTIVNFSASVVVTGATGPHTITVTATNDNGRSVSESVTVFLGPVFQVDAPAILVEIINPIPLDPNDPKTGPLLNNLASQMQHALLPLFSQLASAGMLLAGPNFKLATNPLGVKVLRVGLWIEPATFPVLPPVLPAFPLPRLLDQAASESFDLVPLLPVPDPSGFSPSFAMSVPITTLQRQVDAILPTLQAAASSNDVSIDSIKVTTSGKGSVVTTISGSGPLDIPFSATLTEALGIVEVPDSNPFQSVPAVLSSSHSSSLGSILDWLVSAFIPFATLLLAGAWGYLSSKVGDVSQQVNGVAQALVAAILLRIPFRNSALALLGVPLPDFPALVPDWRFFGVTETEILGTGTTTLIARDQSIVALALNGAGFIAGYQEDLAGGAGQTYGYSLANIAPDSDKFNWQTSGTGSDTGEIDLGPFAQGGSFGAIFPLQIKVQPGEFPFTLTVNGTETCGTDPKKTLTCSASKDVKVKVLKNPKVPK
jgi:hypothetical protein